MFYLHKFKNVSFAEQVENLQYTVNKLTIDCQNYVSQVQIFEDQHSHLIESKQQLEDTLKARNLELEK